MHKPPEPIDAGACFDLDSIARELRGQGAYERNGHAARTLVRSGDLRVVLVAMRSQSHIAEHDASQSSSIHVIQGRVRLSLDSRAVELGAGQLLVLEAGLRHDVEASEDSAFLLTMGWPGQR